MKETISNRDVRELYNKTIKEKYINQYEFERWFKQPHTRLDYFMMHRMVQTCAHAQSFLHYVEVGPGPGTWTKVFYHARPNADFYLVDISEAMYEQFRLEMRDQKNVQYVVDDFISHSFGKRCDVFFSSRALEYFDDKGAFFDKLKSIAGERCSAYIITKNPKLSTLLFNRSPKKQKPPHGGEISVNSIKNLIRSRGFSDIVFYPVIIRIPFLGSLCPWLREWLFNAVVGKRLSERWVSLLSESYLVTFKRE